MLKIESLENFIGTWTLIKCHHELEDGSLIYPLGESAKGLLVYTKEGYMTGALMQPERAKFKTRELFSGTQEEKAFAMEGYLHYSGKFEVHGDEVWHFVDLSLFPNWIGTVQKRRFKFYENKLLLSVGPYVANGVKQTASLLWQRLS
ncbi:MAG: lipocalin-like domain-containing protein [Proteobacteria bacterium]|nr:lipocalin-like domain-containing protein [Pseudomonadota bacterium]NBY19605.1 lipocalin-like domain-containing protein [bacterium]